MKISYLIFIGCLLGLLLFMLYSKISSNGNMVLRCEKNIECLLKDMYGNTVTLPLKPRKLIVYFSAACESCLYELRTLIKRRNELKNISCFFICSVEPGSLQQFAKEFNFVQDSTTVLLADPNGIFRRQYHIIYYPTFLFASNGMAVKHRMEGEIKFSKLLSIIDHEN